MKQFLYILILVLPLSLVAQRKALEELQRQGPGLEKTAGIVDRTGGTHDKSNIRHFFENRGKLYPRRVSDGPDGEWPANSKREYIYRAAPYVGIPGNVIQGRFTTNEEWEAMGGFHNPTQTGKLSPAFSDRPSTWPASGWPVKDEQGNPVIKSDQDSYCAYSDSNNTKGRLGIVVYQTGYAYGMKIARDMLFFKFEIVNVGPVQRDSLYFGLYADVDVGNISGGDPEWGDDKAGFDKDRRLMYFYDGDGKTTEWPGAPPGYFGFAFLATPQQKGITDFHYMLYDDDVDVDATQYGYMASTPDLYNSVQGPKFFHLGANAPDLHYDDPATIPAEGLDILGMASSGPYSLPPGGKLSFVVAFVAGQTLDDLLTNTATAQLIADKDFDIGAEAPPPPNLRAESADGRVILTWDNVSEVTRDKYSKRFDFEGYRLYRSIDKGATWDQIDRNANRLAGPDPVPVVSFDKVNGVGADAGLKYRYEDTTVVNGFEYWYSLTAYDEGDALVPSLESSIGNNLELPNVVSVVPRQDAAGRTAPRAVDVAHTGTGTSDYPLTVMVGDNEGFSAGSYSVAFEPVARVAIGNLLSVITASIAGTAPFQPWAIRFNDATTFNVLNGVTGAAVLSDQPYTSGAAITFGGLSVTITDTNSTMLASFYPEEGDSIVIGPGIRVNRGVQTVLPLQPFTTSTPYATSDGVTLQITPTTYLRGGRLVEGNNLSVATTVFTSDSVVNDVFQVTVTAVDPGASRVAVRVTNQMNAVVAQNDTLASGDALTFKGIRAVLTFTATKMPSVGTRYEITTGIPIPLSYVDAYAFATTGATIDNNAVASELSGIRVVPNPYIVSSLFEEEFGELRREPIRQMRFVNLPPSCSISIFTLDGDLVQTLYHTSGTGVYTWDLRTAGGREITTGVYLYHVKTETAERLDRFAVIK